MKYPPIFQVATGEPAVTALLGANPTRLYLFGLAPDNPAGTYCVWQVINGNPDNYLAGRPDVESHELQVDVYAATASEARAAGQALEYAIELSASISSYNGENKDPETGRYRYSFSVDWIVRR
ncbi:tail completion protein gp17 [Pseudomonas jessenii]|uniref:tail completion protein gp17 n=1 Tax=Pseudomonas jessenii TaxID=77298 RepID=UPI0030BD87E7